MNCILMAASLRLTTDFYCISLDIPQRLLLTRLPTNPSKGISKGQNVYQMKHHAPAARCRAGKGEKHRMK